ncbi:MAG: recombinase family protein, partial [Patescibacteria group bacterium]
MSSKKNADKAASSKVSNFYHLDPQKNRKEELKAIILKAQSSEIPLVVFADSVDRLSRNFKDTIFLNDLVKEGKLEMRFKREGLVVNKDSNAADMARWDLTIMFAQMYIRQLSDNVKRSIAQRKASGQLQ